MQSTTARSVKQGLKSDAILERPAASARPPASANANGAPNEDNIARQSGANDKSSVPNDGTDPAIAALEKGLERFGERGDATKPVSGRKHSNPPPNPPRGTAYNPAPQPSSAIKSRPLPRTATADTTKSSKK